MNTMRKFAVVAAFFAPLFAGCSHTPSVQKAVEPYTYKIDIQQGNVVTQEMVAKLRQGMTPAQVRYVMGSPLVTDPFHPDRWDYVYVYEKGHKVTEHHRVTVIFADGKLDRLEGDVQLQDTPMEQNPAPGAPAAAEPAAAAPAATSAEPAATGVSAPAVAPEAAKPAAAPAASTPASPETTVTDGAAPVAAQPEAAQPATPAQGTATDKPAAQDDVAKSGQEQKPKQRGFFGRMLDKIGL